MHENGSSIEKKQLSFSNRIFSAQKLLTEVQSLLRGGEEGEEDHEICLDLYVSNAIFWKL